MQHTVFSSSSSLIFLGLHGRLKHATLAHIPTSLTSRAAVLRRHCIFGTKGYMCFANGLGINQTFRPVDWIWKKFLGWRAKWAELGQFLPWSNPAHEYPLTPRGGNSDPEIDPIIQAPRSHFMFWSWVRAVFLNQFMKGNSIDTDS